MVKLVRVCVFEAFNLLTMLRNYFTLVQYFFLIFFKCFDPAVQEDSWSEANKIEFKAKFRMRKCLNFSFYYNMSGRRHGKSRAECKRNRKLRRFRKR